MTRKLMIDPPSGWMFGFPKYVDEATGIKVMDYDLDELGDYLMDKGYPEKFIDQVGWTRFMWINVDDH